MLLLSVILAVIAALFGSVLAALHLRADASPPSWRFGATHGVLGALALTALLLALRGPPRGVAMGIGGFGRIAAILLAIALLAGLAIVVARLRYRRATGAIIGIHASIAVTGVVILAAYALVG